MTGRFTDTPEVDFIMDLPVTAVRVGVNEHGTLIRLSSANKKHQILLTAEAWRTIHALLKPCKRCGRVRVGGNLYHRPSSPTLPLCRACYNPSGLPRTRASRTCLRGHALDGENLYVAKDGARVCRTCSREAQRRWRAEHRTPAVKRGRASGGAEGATGTLPLDATQRPVTGREGGKDAVHFTESGAAYRARV